MSRSSLGSRPRLRLAAAAPMVVAAAAALSACGANTGANAGAADGTSAPTAPAAGSSVVADSSAPTSAAAPVGATPPGPYIAVVNGNEIDFYDPSTGTKLSSRPVPVDFYHLNSLPGGPAPDGVKGSFTAVMIGTAGGQSTYSFNGDLTRVAGLDSYSGGDTVPAYLDLVTGTVTDVVAPTDHSGFAKTDPVNYVKALFNPLNGDLWALRNDGGPSYDSGRYTLTGPGGVSADYTWKANPPPDIGLAFPPGATRPSMFAVSQIGSVTPADPPVPDDVMYLPSDAVGKTDFSVGNIRRPDSGKPGGAFLARAPNAAQPVLMVWDGSSTPRQLATVPVAAGSSGGMQIILEVVRYKDV